MSDTPTCPDCAKALERWNKRERYMAARGNFGIVPLPVRCEKHSHVSPITQASRIATLESQLAAQQRENARLMGALERADMALDTAEAHIDEHDLPTSALALQEIKASRTMNKAALAQGDSCCFVMVTAKENK